MLAPQLRRLNSPFRWFLNIVQKHNRMELPRNFKGEGRNRAQQPAKQGGNPDVSDHININKAGN